MKQDDQTLLTEPPMDQFAHDVFAGFGESDPSVQRTAARDSLLLTAQLSVGAHGKPHQVRIRNLSAGGLMAEHPGPAAIGTPVEVELRGLGRVPGHVAWAVNGRIGVAFDTPVDPHRARKPVAARR